MVGVVSADFRSSGSAENRDFPADAEQLLKFFNGVNQPFPVERGFFYGAGIQVSEFFI